MIVEAQYIRSQIAKAAISVLRSDMMELYGVRTSHRISSQGKHLKNRIYEMIAPRVKWWLNEEHKQEVLRQKWLRAA